MSESGSSFLSGFASEEDEDATDGLGTHVKGNVRKGLLVMRASPSVSLDELARYSSNNFMIISFN